MGVAREGEDAEAGRAWFHEVAVTNLMVLIEFLRHSLVQTEEESQDELPVLCAQPLVAQPAF